MSIYKMTVSELAKKEGKPVKEFIEELDEKGFTAKGASHKLTQADLDAIAALFHKITAPPQRTDAEKEIRLANPNVLIIENNSTSFTVALVDASIVNGKIELKVVELSEERSKGEALLEYKKLRGMNGIETVI
jgi:DNA-directed RNA polymerase specialized sigma54-like protein